VEEALLLAHEGEREKANEKLSSNIVRVGSFLLRSDWCLLSINSKARERMLFRVLWHELGVDRG
jgi:hypothetical protein